MTLRDGRITLDLVITVAEATTLVLNGPQFGRLGPGERYPDRQFPELEFRLNGDVMTPRDRFEAMAGGNNITNLLRDAKMDPWAITRDPPVTTAHPRNPQVLNVLRNLGAVADVNGSAVTGAGPLDEAGHGYEAKWVARRMLAIPLAAVADATLRLEYSARPGSAVLADDDPATTTLESTYCVSTTALRRLRSRSSKIAVSIREYEIVTGIDGKAPASLTFSWRASQADRQTARSSVFWCGPGGRSMSGRGIIDRQRASANASGTLRVLTLVR